MIAAIIIADWEREKGETAGFCRGPALTNWAWVDVLGQSIVGRVTGGLKRSGINSVFVLGNQPSSLAAYTVDGQLAALDSWSAAGTKLAKCKDQGFEAVLIVDCSTYAEFDLGDLLTFHFEQGAPVTQVCSADGPIDLWVVNPSRIDGEDLRAAIPEANPVPYEMRGYVNQLRNVTDFRRLALDSFGTRSRLRPRGIEIRPGVWVADSSEVGRNARIVAPAFIGRGVRIADECLITRSTNVERGSHVDFGTAVEDSSILPNTYLGIGLDLSNSVVDGKNLWNLRHDVTLEITDPVVMRTNISSTEDSRQWGELQDDILNLSA